MKTSDYLRSFCDLVVAGDLLCLFWATALLLALTCWSYFLMHDFLDRNVPKDGSVALFITFMFFPPVGWFAIIHMLVVFLWAVLNSLISFVYNVLLGIPIRQSRAWFDNRNKSAEDRVKACAVPYKEPE